MLSKIRFIVWLLVIFIVAFFVSMNSDPKISIKLLPNYQTEPLPLSIVIIGSLITGALIILIIAITDWFKFKLEMVKLRSKLSKLDKELNKCKEEKEKITQELEKLKEEEKTKEEKGLQIQDENTKRENTTSN